MIFGKILKTAAFLLGIAVYAVLYLVGIKLNALYPEQTWVMYASLLVPLLVIGTLVLNFICFLKKKKTKISKISPSEQYKEYLRSRTLACTDYARASANAKLRIALLYTLNTLFVLMNMAYAVAQGYCGTADVFTIYILYDTAKRLVPLSYGVTAIPIPKKDVPHLYELANKCAKQARCKKPDIYVSPSFNITYSSGVLILGVHILPFLTEKQLCSLICQSMFLSKSVSQKIEKMNIRRDELQTHMSSITLIGSEFHKSMLHGVKNKLQLPYGEELRADRCAAKYYPDDLPDALTVLYALDEFLSSSPMGDRPYLLDPRDTSSSFASHVSERAERNKCVLTSTVEYIYASKPNLSARMKHLGRSDTVLKLPNADERLPFSDKIYEIFKEIYSKPYYKYLLEEEREDKRNCMTLTDRYESSGKESFDDVLELLEVADAYCKLDRADDAKKMLDDILASQDTDDDHPSFLWRYGLILLGEEDSDGIDMIMQATADEPEMYDAYRDICDFAAKFGLQNVFDRALNLYLKALDKHTNTSREIFDIDSKTDLYPTTLDEETIKQITEAIHRICGEKLIDIYIVRRKTSEHEDMNLVLINWGISTGDDMYRRVFSYLDARAENFALLIAEDNPMYAYLFLKKVPDSQVYRKH